MIDEKVYPFLRWAGGKSQFTDIIVGSMPPSAEINKYFEPFLGAGSVYLAYRPVEAYLSDLNTDLINTFKAVQERPELVHRYLEGLKRQDSEAYYYEIRNKYNKYTRVSAARAAKFIYLNKACFNGIFRVNTDGEFNVPYGFKKNIAIPSLDHLEKVSRALRGAELSGQDYMSGTLQAGAGDMVYLDPPYPPINGTSFFTHYTKERFPERDQSSVAELAADLDRRGCYVLVTNADIPIIRELYRGWSIKQIQRTRWVTSSKRKHKVSELIISNYDFN